MRKAIFAGYVIFDEEEYCEITRKRLTGKLLKKEHSIFNGYMGGLYE